MRILPVAIKYIDDDFREENVEAVASMTHGHKLSIDCCKIYVEMAVDLLHGMNAIEAYRDVCLRFKCGCDRKLKRFLSGKLLTARRDQIDSSGYVLSTLEAAVWCYFTMITTKIQCLMLSILVMIRTQQLV